MGATPSSRIVVTAVGDIMLGEGVQKIRRGVRAAWAGSDCGALLAHLRPIFAESDLNLGNLECMLGEVDGKDPAKMVYKGSEAHLPGLKATGFTHLSLANNHILEQGLAVAEQTQKLVAQAEMVPCCGANPIRAACRGVTVDLFTYNLIHDTPHLNFYRDAVAEEDFKAIRASDAAVKIVCIHWGEEYSRYPSPGQIELGHRLVDSGACLVLGHHPHVTQGVERYGNGVIAYSMGNFIFDMNWSERTRSSFMLKAEIEDGKVARYSKIPLRQDDRFVPHLAEATPEEAELDQNVLRFQKDAEGYAAYRGKMLKQSRIQALVHLFAHFYQVDGRTWQGLIGKRLRRTHSK